MRGDRVKLINSTHIHEDNSGTLIYVYGVKLDDQGRPLHNHDGTVSIESQGGIKNLSTGVVVGHPEKVHRSQLKENTGAVGLGNNDFVSVIPVMLDTYQKLGWFPADKVRIMEGGVAQ